MDDLPVEISYRILDYTGIFDLRRVALVSTHLRAIATKHDHFYLMVIVDPQLSDQRKSSEVLGHAARLQLPVGFRMTVPVDYPIDADRLRAECGDVFARFQQVFHLVSDLHISASAPVLAILSTFLCRPAPRLRRICLHNCSSEPSLLTLSPSIFAGEAPKLTSGIFGRITLGDAVPAFSGIHRLQLLYDSEAPALTVADHFPAAERVSVTHETSYYSELSFHTDLRGLKTLQHCRIDSGKWPVTEPMYELLDYQAIPAFTWVCEEATLYMFDTQAWRHFWSAVRGPVVVHVWLIDGTEPDFTTRAITSVRGIDAPSFQRTVDYPFLYRNWLPLLRASFIFASRIVHLRLDCAFIGMLLRRDGDPLLMPLLERLHVEVSVWAWDLPGGDYRPGIRCSNLRDVLLVAEKPRPPVPLTECLALGRLLGQEERAPHERPSLRAFGVVFDNNIESSSLFDVFSSHMFTTSEGNWRIGALDISDNWQNAHN